jgi:phytoene desaturase
MKRIVIVGAGVGGLSTAIRLAHAGHRVTVLEKNERVGGKMDLWENDGYRFDTGPSLLTMPFILHELFESVGRRLDAYLDLVPVNPICRYFWPDGSRVDASSDIGATEREVGRLNAGDGASVRMFLEHGRRIYDAAFEPFMMRPFGSMGFRELLKSLKHLPAAARIDAFRSLNTAVEKYFVDGRIRQLFNRFATYNGSSPFRAPATLCIIPYIEFAMGGWYVRGGIYRLAGALERLAREMGIEIRTGIAASVIEHGGNRVRGILTPDGERIDADIVVSNADALYASKELLQEGASTRTIEPSLAGFVLLLGVRKIWPGLAHHNVFFSDDYRAEFDTMFTEGRPAKNPTIYVCDASSTESGHAPVGCSSLFVLVNAPPLPVEKGKGTDWNSVKSEYRDRIIGILERRGLSGLSDAIDIERTITPLDFETKYNAFRGSIYGTSSNSRAAAFLRPPNKSRRYRNLYFVGGSSHPGGGIPLVLLSGRIVADMIAREQVAA